MLLKILQLCFWMGVLFTGASFVLGQLFDFAEIDTDTNTSGGEGMVSPFKPVVMAAFITVFGGVGIISLSFLGLSVLAALVFSFSIALLISFLMYRLLIVPLYKAQSTSAVSQDELIGQIARVQLGIRGSNFGKISYVVNSSTYTAPARSLGNEDIAKEEKVVIVDIEDNVFKVTKL